MSNKKVEKGKNTSYIIPGILLSIIIIAILSSFGIKMVDDAKSKVKEDYEQEARQICKLYEKEVYAIEKAAYLMSVGLLEDEALITEQHIDDIRMVGEALDIKNVYVVDNDYNSTDMYGKEYERINTLEPFDTVFEKSYDTYRYLTNSKGEEALYIIKPVASKNSLRGYIVVEYTPKIMDTLLKNPKYSERKSFALVSSDGDVIEMTGKSTVLCQKGQNIIDSAKNLLYVDGSYTAFRQSIFDCRSGSNQALYKEEGKYIYQAPVEGTKSLVMIFVDTEDVERSFAAVSKNIRNMLIEIGITIVAFLAIFAFIGLFNKMKYNIESEDLQNKADTDLLTDLYNKMATERMIKEYLEGPGKEGMSMLFVLDVDDFKKINDTKGHAFGDQVLSQFGHQIRAWFRVNDIIGRIGGDEFMIFIKDVKDPEAVKREGSRIMQFFDGFNVGEYAKYSPTASVGGAVYPRDGADFESLYKAADKAVYKSKKEGKNRVSFYSDLNNQEKDAEHSKTE